MSKYHSRKVAVDGITFDSKKEANRYKELLLLQRAKKISNLALQQAFILQPSFKKNGKTIRAITYVADFVYLDLESKKTVVEDAKGFKTDVYRLKKKMFEFKYPTLTIVEV